MTNVQVRLIASALALLASAILATTTNIDVNLSIVFILVSAAIFMIEYIRCQKD